MRVQVKFDGDRTSDPVPENLKEWYKPELLRVQRDETNFVFAEGITAQNDNPAAIEGWLQARLHEVKVWVESIEQ